MCDYDNFCLETIDGNAWGVLLEAVLLLYTFVGIAAVADSYLAVGLEVLVERWRIPEDVAGASFLALGGAAPEIMVSVISTCKGAVYRSGSGSLAAIVAEAKAQSLGLSSIFGSGILAFTVIPGVCAIMASEPIEVDWWPLARDAVAYTLSAGGVMLAVMHGKIGWVSSSLLLVGYAGYLGAVLLIRESKEPEEDEAEKDKGEKVPLQADLEKIAAAKLENRLGSDWQIGCPETGGPAYTGGRTTMSDEETHLPSSSDEERSDDEKSDDDDGINWGPLAIPFKPMLQLVAWTCPECEEKPDRYPITLISAFIWLAFLSALLSAVVVRFGAHLHLEAATMGLFVVAIGAQLPDTIQAMAIARRGHGSMAIAGVTGSQLINILVGLGLPWTITALTAADVVVAPKVKGGAVDAVSVPSLELMGCLASACAILYVGVLAHAYIRGDKKFTLGRTEGALLSARYFVTMTIYVLLAERS